jgi:hypothetical protein
MRGLALLHPTPAAPERGIRISVLSRFLASIPEPLPLRTHMAKLATLLLATCFVRFTEQLTISFPPSTVSSEFAELHYRKKTAKEKFVTAIVQAIPGHPTVCPLKCLADWLHRTTPQPSFASPNTSLPPHPLFHCSEDSLRKSVADLVHQAGLLDATPYKVKHAATAQLLDKGFESLINIIGHWAPGSSVGVHVYGKGRNTAAAALGLEVTG